MMRQDEFHDYSSNGELEFMLQDMTCRPAAITTLPETNIAPENDPLEKEIPIGNHHF